MPPRHRTAPSRGRKISGVDPVDIEVGETVRLARMQAGLTQSELGQAIGVTFQQVQKYERGANRISASMLVRISRTVGLPVSALFPNEIDPTTTGVRLEVLPRGHALAVAFVALSESNRALVLNLAEALAEQGRKTGELDV